MYDEPRYLVAGDRALVVEFGDRIERDASLRVRSLDTAIGLRQIRGVEELVPSYRSLMIVYDPLVIGFGELIDRVRSIEAHPGLLPEPQTIRVPVKYGGEDGPDIEFIAELAGITADDVTAIHASRDYPVYMIGFTPGFPYLGEVDQRIAAPRLDSPRLSVPAGSVGIAETQTGIYPIKSPGGWRIIGRTPLRLFDPRRDRPFLIDAGDVVRFIPIDRDEFERIEAGLDAGR